MGEGVNNDAIKHGKEVGREVQRAEVGEDGSGDVHRVLTSPSLDSVEAWLIASEGQCPQSVQTQLSDHLPRVGRRALESIGGQEEWRFEAVAERQTVALRR